MRISDWSSDVCSSDLNLLLRYFRGVSEQQVGREIRCSQQRFAAGVIADAARARSRRIARRNAVQQLADGQIFAIFGIEEIHRGIERQIGRDRPAEIEIDRSEEHTSELQSLMRITYAVFCLKNKKKKEK